MPGGGADRASTEVGVNDPELVYGVHPVLELLKQRASAIDRLFVARQPAPGLGRILRAAREAGIPVTRLPKPLLARKVGARAVHQGIAARVAPIPYADVEELCRRAAADPDGLLVWADRVVDPGNLGSIIRTAAGAGATGVILSAEETVGLTPAVAKVSAGAVERIPVARDPRPPRRIEALGKAGFRTFVLDPRGGRPWDHADLTGRLVLVCGGEGRGVRPATARACNHRVTIPLDREMDSLNVGISAGVLLFEALRQRRGRSGGS